MNKVIIMPDSFKGSITSNEATDILSNVVQKYITPNIIKLPIADGGEGSTDCILRIKGGIKKETLVHSPDQQIIHACTGVLEDNTAIIELAESSGITKQDCLHPLDSNTYGFGELIKFALDCGYRKFYLCLGGSASTDCGCGMAKALGIEFYDSNNQSFIPSGGTLSKINRIDFSNLDKRIQESKFTIMSDVTNPLYGTLGAAYIYGPQKGASLEQIQLLDEGLMHVSKLIEEKTQVSPTLEGAGAAGGTGYGCVTFLNAEIVSGIDGLLNLCNFDSMLEDCSLIVTGEGCLDEQSLMGKVLSGIRKHAKDIDIVSFCGKCKVSKEELKTKHITAIEIAPNIPLEESIKNGKYYLEQSAEQYFKTCKKM